MDDCESLKHTRWECKYHGKSAIHIARTFGGRAKNFTGEHFWARGYYVSTIGGDEQAIREYSKKQQEEDRRRPNEDVRLTAAEGGSQSIRFERFTFQASTSGGGIDWVRSPPLAIG